MPDLVETMMYAESQGVPWHGLGQKISDTDRYDIVASIRDSGLGWGVDLVELFMNDRHPDTGAIVPRSMKDFVQAVRRDTDKKVLGTVGPRYTPLQNTDAFKWFQPMLDAKLCSLDTAGSLDEGSKVWILAEVKADNPLVVVGDDIIKRYLLLSNSHDGTTAVRIGFTPIRVVCANTLSMAHSNAGSKLLRLRHSKSLYENLDKLQEVINLANKEFDATAEQYRFLANKRCVNKKDLQKFVRIMAGIKEDELDADISTRSKNIMERMLTLMVSGSGNDSPKVKGTWWAAYNGFTQYQAWEKGNSDSSRYDSLWFGKGYNDNIKALNLATELANAA